MTYSSGTPGSSGFPPAQPPGSYGAPSQGAPAVDAGPSRLPQLLTAIAAGLGLLAYLVTFGPMFTLSTELGAFGGEISAGGSGLPVLAVLTAALLAAVSLLPKAHNYAAIVAVLATLGTLLAITDLVGKPEGFSVGWAFWVFLALALLQTAAAIGALLLESGLITPPAPRPKYEQPQYGQYGPPGGYYGQQPGAPGQRPGYPSQYGGYPQQGPGGYGAPGQQSTQQGPPTPPTGYPSFSQPPAVGSGQQQPSSGGFAANAPTQQAPTQQQPPTGPSTQ
jgi:hypothetical protein